MLHFRVLPVTLGILGFTFTASAQSGFKVVAHPSASVESLTASATSDIFMKKTAKWPDGTPTIPVDQKVDSRVRAAFSEAIHGKNASAVDAFWQRQIFSGRGSPPVMQGSDAQVVAFVGANPGAIGYVSAGAATEGVKTVTIR